MKILALDTSTLTASVCLMQDGQVRAAADDAVSTHSDILLPMIERVLDEAGVPVGQLDAVAVGAGPGSFTGLRIGMSTAKGIAFSIGAPLWVVSSLAALAQDAADHLGADAGGQIIAPAIDARRGEIFCGLYRVGAGGLVESIADERVVDPEAFDTGGRQVLLCGDGSVAYADQLARIGTPIEGARTTPSARSVARLGASGDRDDVLMSSAPAYIRKSEAEIRFPHGNPGGTFSKDQ